MVSPVTAGVASLDTPTVDIGELPGVESNNIRSMHQTIMTQEVIMRITKLLTGELTTLVASSMAVKAVRGGTTRKKCVKIRQIRPRARVVTALTLNVDLEAF